MLEFIGECIIIFFKGVIGFGIVTLFVSVIAKCFEHVFVYLGERKMK
jgi:hypothetical protein